MKKQKGKKRMKLWAKLLLGLGLCILLLATAALSLVFRLLDRLNRNGNTSFVDDEGEGGFYPSLTVPSPAWEEASPSPTPSSALGAAASALSPDASPAPLSDVYAQTVLSDGQLAQISADYESGDFLNVLLIGVDRRGSSGNSSSDTMIIATVDKRNKRLKLTTLMRDMLVDIPGYGYGKLNASAARGGVELLLSTIEHNFHVPTEGYVLVDFNMFVEIIDRMGGLTIVMSAEEISAANDCIAGLNKQTGVDYLWDGFIFAEAGPVQLTGKQALGYARIRKIDSDFTRTERQYKVLNALFAKFMRLSLTAQYSLIYDLLPMVETNLSNGAIIDLAAGALQMDAGGLLHYRAPAEQTYENGKYERKSVLLTDVGANTLLIHSFITASKDGVKLAEELEANPSLPPRTPTPTYDPALFYDPGVNYYDPYATHYDPGLGYAPGFENNSWE